MNDVSGLSLIEIKKRRSLGDYSCIASLDVSFVWSFMFSFLCAYYADYVAVF